MAREPYFNLYKPRIYGLKIHKKKKKKKKKTSITMLAISTWQSRPRDKG